jgi:broad specificity phosphatase PhoE
MPVKITYLVHGTSVDNGKGVASGWKDTELSELGLKAGWLAFGHARAKHLAGQLEIVP